ncbi:MAG TPA: TetR/AcrR family transcriptional regulator [Solirubrobacteraceae bacterium]|jgi:AcrR family transcriptional regulator|nr:TetR/AcrR family transcriptional regulator [Solirubrobacteraceae bacterium]
MARQSKREQQGRHAKARGNTRGHEQVERAKAQEPTRERKPAERAETPEPTRERKTNERTEIQESTREYKQVERAKAQERTREALIAAATDEFFEGNWLKTSLDSLSRRAGVTRQTLLRHFGSKDGLLMQSLMRGASQVRDQRWSTPTTDISGAVENVIEHYEEWGERSVRIGAWQRGPTVLALFSNAARQIHYDWVEHAFAQWLVKFDEETRARRRATLIVLCDVQTWWTLSNDLGLPRREVHAILTEQIERALEER